MNISPKSRAVRVLDLCCGSRRVSRNLSIRFPDREVHYIGIDESPGYNSSPLPSGVSEDVYSLSLNFSNPVALAEQLKGILGSEKVDEIHYHLPDQRHFIPGLLESIGQFLKPDGVFYSMFQSERGEVPFLRSQLVNQVTSHEDGSQWYEKNKRNIEDELKGSPFNLQRYGMRMHVKVGYQPFGTRWYLGQRLAGKMKQRIFSDHFDSILDRSSEVANYADHFVILRKKKITS